MEGLRIVGVVFAAVFLVFTFRARRQAQLSRLNSLVALLFAAVLAVVSIYPDASTPFLELFDFRQGESSGRLIGLLVLSNLLLYLLFLRNAGVADLVNRNLTRFVQSQARQRFDEEFPSKDLGAICVVIPAYNEAENLGAVLERMPSQIDQHRVSVLVCVDGATDDTAVVAKKHGVAVAVHGINLGGGAALSTGYQIAIDKGADIVVTIDADGQNHPEEMPNLVRPLLNREADMTSGSRRLGSFEQDSLIRRAGVYFFSGVASILNRKRITDLSSGYRAIRSDCLQRLDLQQQQFHASEFMIEALSKGLRVKEVPITFSRRSGGESKKPGTFRYGWGFTKAILQTWLR